MQVRSDVAEDIAEQSCTPLVAGPALIKIHYIKIMERLLSVLVIPMILPLVVRKPVLAPGGLIGNFSVRRTAHVRPRHKFRNSIRDVANYYCSNGAVQSDLVANCSRD